jgi:polyisoprenoid-binding protein YceI
MGRATDRQRPRFIGGPMLHRIWLTLPLAACLAASAHAADFAIQPDAASRVEFVSKAPMETFGGKTRKVSGSVALDPAQLGDSITVLVSVDMGSLDTGIDLRNKHMRDNHLHCDKYPTATFRGGRLSKLSASSLTEGQTVTGVITGEMELHGVKRPLEAPVEMTFHNGGLHVVSRFKVKLPDYQIPRPQFLVMKLDETQSVTLEVEARSK